MEHLLFLPSLAGKRAMRTEKLHKEDEDSVCNDDDEHGN
jgi:hypothetical protein